MLLELFAAVSLLLTWHPEKLSVSLPIRGKEYCWSLMLCDMDFGLPSMICEESGTFSWIISILCNGGESVSDGDFVALSLIERMFSWDPTLCTWSKDLSLDIVLFFFMSAFFSDSFGVSMRLSVMEALLAELDTELVAWDRFGE